MFKIIIASHGGLVNGVIDTLGYFIDNLNGIYPVSLDKKGLNKFSAEVDQLLEKLKGEDLLIFTDFLYGTPFNVFTKRVLNLKSDCEIIAGMNMPAILEAVIQQTHGKRLNDVLPQIMKAAQPVTLKEKVQQSNHHIDDE